MAEFMSFLQFLHSEITSETPTAYKKLCVFELLEFEIVILDLHIFVVMNFLLLYAAPVLGNTKP